MDDIALVRRCNKDTWDGLSYKQQASLIDNFYEDTGINRNEDNDGDCYASDDYFNVLKIDSGENVVVDFENDANVSISFKFFPFIKFIINFVINTTSKYPIIVYSDK